MIPDAYRYYGAVFSSIIELSSVQTVIEKIPDSYAGFYLINSNVPIYIKYSTNRRGSWAFNFHKNHQECLQKLYNNYGTCVVILVCGKDGLVALAYEELRQVLDQAFEEQESISVRRRHNEMYRVCGHDGALKRKISRSSLREILQKL